MDFPHLDHGMLDGWLRDHSATPVGYEAPLGEKIDALLDRCETLVRSGEEPEALDHFIYGYLYPGNLRAAGVDPDEVAERERLDVWNHEHGTE